MIFRRSRTLHKLEETLKRAIIIIVDKSIGFALCEIERDHLGRHPANGVLHRTSMDSYGIGTFT